MTNVQQVACDLLDSTCNFEGNNWRRGVSGASLRDTEDAVLACDQDEGPAFHSAGLMQAIIRVCAFPPSKS